MNDRAPTSSSPSGRHRAVIVALSVLLVLATGAAVGIGVDANNKTSDWQATLDRAVHQRDLAIERALESEASKSELAAQIEAIQQSSDPLEERVVELSADVAFLRDLLVERGYDGPLVAPEQP